MLTGIPLFLSVLFSSLLAGYLGSLTGLGGGTILVPILTLYDGIPIEYATGASLISTIATSSGAASAYLKDKIINLKIGTSLQVATTSGAIAGSLTATYIYSHHLEPIIYVVFGIVLLGSVYPTIKRGKFEIPMNSDPDWSTKFFQMHGEYYDIALQKKVEYWGVRWVQGASVMFVAGYVSGLLGIGSGALKVIGMDWVMNLPIKVTTTTSNFMIGVTAATSSGIYWVFGYIQPLIAAATSIGVLIGAFIGTKTLVKLKNKRIRTIFTILLAFLGIQMILRGLGIY
jgi:hypothetical protein